MTTTLSPFPAHQAPPAAEELRYFVDELRKMHSAFLILVRDAEDNDGWLGRDLAEEWQLRFDDLIGSKPMKWLDRVCDERLREALDEHAAQVRDGEKGEA